MLLVADLKKSHNESLLKLGGKLRNLEEDVAATQKDVTKKALKRVWRDCPYEF